MIAEVNRENKNNDITLSSLQCCLLVRIWDSNYKQEYLGKYRVEKRVEEEWELEAIMERTE